MKASSSNGKIKGFLIKGVSLIMAICMLMPTGCKRQNNTDTQESKDNNNQTVQTNRADKPTDLKINLLADPFGVDKNDLRFSWVMNDPDKNEMQTAYRILISRSSAKISEKDYLFDSGWVESGDNTAVSLAGLLSFVGLLVPHAVRRLAGGKSSRVTGLCAIYGSAFVCLCDTLARVVFAPFELPVGIIMAYLGAPFFIFILIKGKGGQKNAES